MKFKTLQKLADAVADKLGKYVSIEVEYNCYSDTSQQILYCFYSQGDAHRGFDTAQELKTHMENILNPVDDEGVEV